MRAVPSSTRSAQEPLKTCRNCSTGSWRSSPTSVSPTRWAETADGTVLIEWVNTGTLCGAPVELRGADRFTLKEGKACEGRSYLDPRPFLQAPSAAAGQ